jgi:integrase
MGIDNRQESGVVSNMPPYKRGDTWMYRFDLPGSTKKARKQVSDSGFTTKKEAANAEAARRIAVQQEHKFDIAGTLGSLLEKFFTEHGKKRLAGKTLHRYREMANYLDAELLAMPLGDVKPLRLSQEWNRLLASGGRHRSTKEARPLSAKTVRNIAGMVSSAYTRAQEWEMQAGSDVLIVNPVRFSRPPIPAKRTGQAITVKTEARMVKTTKKAWGLAAFLELGAATGARRGELLGLQWSDLRGNIVTIEHSLSQVGQTVELKSTKTDEPRTITVPASAMKVLRAHRQKQWKFRAHFGDSYQGDFIFCNPDGSPLKPDSVSAAVSALCRELGLPKGVSLHTLRHSHGSQLLAEGVPLPDVSARLGHSDPEVTARIYSHRMHGGDAKAAKAWELHRGGQKSKMP